MRDLSAQYLRGIELFNAGKFFECHEELEEIWLKTEGIEREFLHALIQVAAALHHVQNGNFKGAHSVYERARRKFETMPPIAMRLDTASFTQELEGYFSAVLNGQNSSTPLPQIKLEDKS